MEVRLDSAGKDVIGVDVPEVPGDRVLKDEKRMI
jgi:hypothetical protein